MSGFLFNSTKPSAFDNVGTPSGVAYSGGGLSTGISAGLATGGLATNGLATGGLATGGLSTGGLLTGGLATDRLATGGLSTGNNALIVFKHHLFYQ